MKTLLIGDAHGRVFHALLSVVAIFASVCLS